MQGDSNRRTHWFDDAYGAPRPHEIGVPSPIEAQAMVDQAIHDLGVDPREATDPEGWRHIALGTAEGLVNVVEWEEGIHFLVVWSPMLRAPQDARLRAELFEVLLDLNHQSTGMARFSLHDDMVVLAAVRPIHGLDLVEVLDAIRIVMRTADLLDERLQQVFQIPMPHIEMDSQTWRGILDVLRLCDPQAQHTFTDLMERWVAKKGKVATGRGSIGLVGGVSGKTLAAIIGYASAGPLIAVSWDSLEKVWGVQPKDAAAFKKALPRPERFETTGHSAHLPVDDSFTQQMGDQLIDALLKLDKALQRAAPREKEPLPDLAARWKLNIQVGGATQRNIDALLAACPEPVQQIYIRLIQGWYDTGQALYTNQPDRVYLRLAVDEHSFALCTLRGPQKTREPRIELFYPLSYYLEQRTEARRHYEQEIVKIAGFTVHNSGARIQMGEGFTDREAGRLLQALSSLAKAAAQA